MNTVTAMNPKSNGRMLDGAKEQISALVVVGTIKGGPLAEIAKARFWMARRSDGASPVYCSVWLHTAGHTSGHGTARGYGYHKQSAALQAALDSAGVKLETAVDGVGDGAMDDAMLALARFAGSRDAIVVRA